MSFGLDRTKIFLICYKYLGEEPLSASSVVNGEKEGLQRDVIGETWRRETSVFLFIRNLKTLGYCSRALGS